jgi:hypothetical protein
VGCGHGHADTAQGRHVPHAHLPAADLYGCGNGADRGEHGLWAVASFRPGEIDPEITQAFNDAGFIILLGTWFPFTMWAIALGLSILLDKSDSPVYPRSSGYFSIWAGIGFIPGGTVWFFKSGPFGWTGVVCIWIPFGVFGAWLLYFAYQTALNVRRGYVNVQDLQPAS